MLSVISTIQASLGSSSIVETCRLQVERNGKAFIAMEFLDGLTLKHCIGGNAIQVMGG